MSGVLANQRQGTRDQDARRRAGGNQKPWKQKGTGRARQGSARSESGRAAARPFDRTPRSYAQAATLPDRRALGAQERACNARACENADRRDRWLRTLDAPKTIRPMRPRWRSARWRRANEGSRPDQRRRKPNVYPSGRNLRERARCAVHRRLDVPRARGPTWSSSSRRRLTGASTEDANAEVQARAAAEARSRPGPAHRPRRP